MTISTTLRALMRNYFALLLSSVLVGCTYIPVLLSDNKPTAASSELITLPDAPVAAIQPPEVVLDAGMRVNVGQELLTIWGEDPCQPGFSGNTKLNCIGLANRDKVRVHFIRNGMLDVEDWQVSRVDGRYKLVTPAGVEVSERFQ